MRVYHGLIVALAWINLGACNMMILELYEVTMYHRPNKH